VLGAVYKTKEKVKNLLVPFDFSPYSISAAKCGAFIARKTGAHVHILHTVDGPTDWDQLTATGRQARVDVKMGLEQGYSKLEKFCKGSIFKGLAFTAHVRVGIPYQKIIQLANTEHASLIIMGAHGADESHDAFIGSTAQRVLRIANCPVLSVKKSFKAGAFKKILFSSDFEENIQATIGTVQSIAKELKASIELTFVNTPGNFVDTQSIEKRIEQHMPNRNGVKFNHIIYNDYNKESGIINAAKKRGADMIAIVTHNRKGKPSYLFGITETLLYHSDIPVLSLVIQ
jgi:nucleotide-binding universal stress UspA family protein